MGWAAPAGRESTQLVHAGNGRMMVCLRREDRILPAAVVREQVEEKAEAIGLAESPRSAAGKATHQDEVITDLLPRAFTRSSHPIRLYRPTGRLGGGGQRHRERPRNLLGMLRETLGSLRSGRWQSTRAPAAVLTHWLETAPAEGSNLVTV